jgi:F0F1-type ATP synthase membrane subunit b/b'
MPAILIPWIFATLMLAAGWAATDAFVEGLKIAAFWYWIAGVVTYIIWRRNKDVTDTLEAAARLQEIVEQERGERRQEVANLNQPPGW